MLKEETIIKKRTRLATDEEVRNLILFICSQNIEADKRLFPNQNELDIISNNYEYLQNNYEAYFFQNGTNEDVMVTEIEHSKFSVYSYLMLTPDMQDNLDVLHYQGKYLYNKSKETFEDISNLDYSTLF